MICSNCATDNKPGRKFCVGCATPLAAACPSCDAPYDPDDTFCGECATPLRNAAAPLPGSVRHETPAGAAVRAGAAAPATPVAERRLVSVLFADLVGFTPFAEERDAEDVRDTLTRYFDVATDVITRYGGTVEKFIGDAVMAIWGAPTAREDDAERSVRAALDLVDAVRTLGPGIQARAGVLTGEAAVTIGATNQGMVAGDLVNTAARLQSVAQPGTVLVGEPTMRAASAAIAFEEAVDQALKGKTAPVPAWRALRVVAQRGGRNRSDALEAPFVGRDEELRLLKDLFRATVREGRARLVSVTGVAGIGKSRLAWEFLKHIDGLADGVWWHDGRSPAYGSGVTFWALGEMVRGRCGLAEGDDEPTTRARVAAMLAEHVPDAADRRWIEPALLVLLGLESGIGSEQLFGAWRLFFERLAASAPVVLVFEDLHHADSGTLDFIDHLMAWSRQVPLLVVTLARPELLERRPDWGVGVRSFTSVYLEPLPEPAMRALLAGLVPGIPEPAARAIVTRAEGIPLYAVETVRMLVDDGRLVAAGDRTFAPAGDLTTLAVPATLTALVASRLDGLEPAERALASDAAVLGQSFTAAGLAAVSGIAEADLAPRLRSLVRREILAVDGDPRSPERGQHAFVQALIREVAYNTLARADRRSRHLAAARHLESLGSDELAGALAGHYLAAYQNAPAGAEADALAAQARVSLRAAAERAISLGSHDQAVGFLEQALAVTSEPAEQAELLERAGESAMLAGDGEQGGAFLEQAIQLRRESGDRVAIARATTVLGRVLMNTHQLEQAAALLEPAAAEFADLAPDPAVVGLGAQLGRAYFLRGDTTRALQILEPVLEAAEHADLGAILADALVTKGSALADTGRTREGLGVLEAGERLARELELVETVLRGLYNRIATVFDFEPGAFLAGSREGLALAQRIGDRRSAALYESDLGFALMNMGAWDEALGVIASGLAEDPEPGTRIAFVSGQVFIAAARGAPIDAGLADLAAAAEKVTDPNVLWLSGDSRAFAALAAGRLAEAGDAWRDLVSNPGAIPYLRVEAARSALWQRDAASAAKDLASLDALGFHRPLYDTYRLAILAGLAALDGRLAEAAGLYRDALRRLRDLGLPFEEALVGIDMATLLDPADPEVQAAAERSREILVRLGAKPFIERLDAALARSSATHSAI